MVELDEKDIRGVALNRFHRKKEKQLAATLLVFLGFFLSFLYLEGKVEGFPDFLVFVPIGIILIGSILYINRMNKFVRSFLKEWNQEK